MTNYNERLDKILSKTPCSQCDGSGAYADYDGEPVQCQFCWQLRFTFIDEARQALTSLIKELVEKAKPMVASREVIETYLQNGMTQKAAECHGRNHAINQFEQNLLKELEEV